jgi:NADH:ubiquinone oxidoreductase subunit 4 (subunit M)
MLNWPILSVIAFLPLAGALLIAVMPSHGEAEQRNVRWIALWVTLVTFAIALLFDGSRARSSITWASTASLCRSWSSPPA